MRTKHQPGFTMIELITYMLFVTLLIVTIMTGLVRFMHELQIRHKRQKQALALAAAYDHLLFDLERAPAQRKQWLLCAPESIIWRVTEGAIGWQKKKDRLIRITGDYNTQTNRWSSATRSLVAQDIQAAQFDVSGNDVIRHVRCFLQTSACMMECKAVPGCRRIV